MGSEKHLQAKVVSWAREKYKGRLIARKFQGGVYGANGWPDYDFLVKGKPSMIFFIEFKAPGGVCTDLQLQRHQELRGLGFKVFVCNDAAMAKEIITGEVEGRSRYRGA